MRASIRQFILTKKDIHYENCAILVIIVGGVFAYLDIMPVASLLLIVGGAAFLIAHYSDKGGSGSSSGSSISTTEAAFVVYGDSWFVLRLKDIPYENL